MNIHPTAIIDPAAQIADDVQIGPFVCIEGAAVIGGGCVIHAHAVISGAVRMGERNVIGHHAIIGTFPQDLAFKAETRSEVIIGSDNVIRELSTIHRGTAEGSATRVGDHCYFMAGAHLAHNVQVGNHVIIANNALLGGHVHVADRVFIGGGCVFHQFVRVGRLAITQGLSAFSKDIPPFTLAAERNNVVGLNVVGLRRSGLALEARNEIKRAFKLLYQSGRNVSQALEAANGEAWSAESAEFFQFVRDAKKRGVCSLLESRKAANHEVAE